VNHKITLDDVVKMMCQ